MPPGGCAIATKEQIVKRVVIREYFM